MGVDWVSEEATFEYMDCMLTSGTWKNFSFFIRSCLFTECESVTKLISVLHHL
jgi:hypothetical protein